LLSDNLTWSLAYYGTSSCFYSPLHTKWSNFRPHQIVKLYWVQNRSVLEAIVKMFGAVCCSDRPQVWQQCVLNSRNLEFCGNQDYKRFLKICKNGGWGSVACITTLWVLDGPGIEYRWGHNLPCTSRPAAMNTQPPVQGVCSSYF